MFQGVLGISATNSGALITPMIFGLLGASTLTGFLMRRIRYYRYLGTFGVVVMIVGMWLQRTKPEALANAQKIYVEDETVDRAPEPAPA